MYPSLLLTFLECDNSNNNFCETGQCNQTKCYQCKEKYYIENGNCALCDTGINHCSFQHCSPTYEGICDDCVDGYYLDSTNHCVSCSDNCTKCLDENTCIECEEI